MFKQQSVSIHPDRGRPIEGARTRECYQNCEYYTGMLRPAHDRTSGRIREWMDRLVAAKETARGVMDGWQGKRAEKAKQQQAVLLYPVGCEVYVHEERAALDGEGMSRRRWVGPYQVLKQLKGGVVLVFGPGRT